MVMWQDTSGLTYQSGMLYLGKDDGREIGLPTERHALTIAGAGAGKGVSVIIPNLLRWPHNALVIDPKGEAAEATAEHREKMGHAVHVLDPFGVANVDERFRASFNPLAQLDPDALTIKEDIEAIADGIVMRSDTSAAHWDDGAQTVICGVIAFLVLTGDESERNLIEMRSIIRDSDTFEGVATAMKTLTGCAGLCQAGASAYFAKEGGYFKSNAEKNTRWLDSGGMVNVLASSSFALSDLKNGKASVFLVLPANYLGQHGRFLRLFVRCAIEEMARRSTDGKLRGEQCLFLLDEFFSLGYIDEIAKAAGLMRGYGLQLWPILQDLGQLLTLYGREGSETFFGNADLHQFFGNTDKLTLEYMSAMTGVVGVDEVGAAPDAPLISGGGQSLIAAAASQSQVGSTRAMGAVWGAMSGSMNQFVAAAQQAHHQNEMNAYQQKMATVGKPRLTVEEIARLVQRKNDVVADAMFCVAYGSDRLLVKPAPFFRPLETPEPEPQKLSAWQKVRAHDAKMREQAASKPVWQNALGTTFWGTLAFSLVCINANIMPAEDAFIIGLLLSSAIGWPVAIIRKRRRDKKAADN